LHRTSHATEGSSLGHALELIRDYPGPGDWFVGLLMLDPDVRSSGLGSRLHAALERALADVGGRAIYLAVLEQNAGAERFWRRQGFEERARQHYTSANGHDSRVIVMRRALS
jgi:ribosomal protein S18 acetylase RimI-like enzyme